MCFCLLCVSGAFAQKSTVTLGGKEGWPSFESSYGIDRGTGRFGFDCIELATNVRSMDKDTDLYIDFENNQIIDRTNKYNVEDDDITVSSGSAMGKSCGMVRRNTSGLKLSGKEGSLFGSAGNMGSFLIEFWLCPSIAENGEQILSWRSSRTVSEYPLYQMIYAGFANNHFEWKFINVFNGYTQNDGEVTVTSYRNVVPDVWSHHEISYDEHTGMLEYRINGVLEGLTYVTSNGREIGGSVYPAVLGVTAALEFCPEYTGYIDDIRIQRNCYNESAREMRYDTYKKDGGRFVTQPIMMSDGCVLNSVRAVVQEPAQTAVVMYVRSDKDHFNWTDTYPEWKRIESNQEIEGVEGLYFQVAVDLFPDGGGKSSPSITQLDLNFTELPLPLPPYTLTAIPGDGEVTLVWNYSVDDISGGYYVYYGERPGEYLCREALEGESPIDVGNVIKVKITGLKNGKIYYFAISSYSKYSKNISGELSREVNARPLKK